MQCVIFSELQERVRREEEAVKREREKAQRQREEAQRQREQELREARERQIREDEQVTILAATALDTQKDSPPSEPASDANQASVSEYPPSLDTGDSFTEVIVPEESVALVQNLGDEEPPSEPKNYQWPSNESPSGPSSGQPPESLHITATDPNLAHVLPEIIPRHNVSQVPMSSTPHPVDSESVPPTSGMGGLMVRDASQSVTPSAPPPPAYNQVS